ncbi:unnamed protein product [Phytophthora fragariaefolia]|uniref:Unnamed protein product n=1 Tax=Phytophthora fragariaefolia TaxID=1490495 RepID=A0A9W6Y2F0_9STRA|nr:unnamed protein product [Phytophthora fragariaefolia]
MVVIEGISGPSDGRNDGDAVATSANVRVASGNTPRAGNDHNGDDNVIELDTDTGDGDGGSDGGMTPAAPTRVVRQHGVATGGSTETTPPAPPPPTPPTTTALMMATVVYREPRR